MASTIPKVTEEALRRDAPHRGRFRITTRDTTLGGTELSAGTPLFLLFGSGNRDESVFPNPDAVDLDRTNARDHLAFGRGLHVCPGAPMARAEIRVALETLIHACPGCGLPTATSRPTSPATSSAGWSHSTSPGDPPNPPFNRRQ